MTLRRLAWLAMAGTMLAIGLAAGGQEGVSERSSNTDPLPLDREALNTLPSSERRAALRAYKRARAEAARNAEIEPRASGFRRLETPRRVESQGLRPRIAGSGIRYDSGTVIGSAGFPSRMLGNRFDSGLNPAGTMCCYPVEMSGSITMITFALVTVSSVFQVATWSLYSDIMGTSARQVTSASRTVAVGLNTFTVMSPTTKTATFMNGPFLAGIFQGSATELAVDTMTTGGQGFHAISIGLGILTTGTGLTDVTTGMGGGLNAIFRVRGNVSTPVELMDFTILE